MLMKKLLTAAFTATLFGSFVLPASALDEGAYIGGSLGQASFKEKELDDIKIDDDSSAWKVFGGARWGVMAIEGGYVDFGDVNELAGPNSRGVKTTGLDAFGMLALPVGPIDLFGKLGGIYWNSDTVFNGLSASDNGFDLAWGLGVGLRFGSASIRVEYEKFEVDVLDDLNMYSAGFAWTF